MPVRACIALGLVIGLAGCSLTSPSVAPSPVLQTSPATSDVASSRPSPSAEPLSRPTHRTITGPTVAGAFDAATDGRVITWSSGRVDVDAPDLWTYDPASEATTRTYRSSGQGAILANLAVRDGRFAFAEVT